MDGNILDPGSATERLADWKGRIDKLAADTQSMSDRLQAVRVTVSDPTGLVEVTVDSAGALTNLRLSDRMQRMTPAAVARTIMATVGEAKAGLADRSQEIIAETMGTESRAARAIAANIERHLRNGPVAERAADEGYDEGYDTRSYLSR